MNAKTAEAHVGASGTYTAYEGGVSLDEKLLLETVREMMHQEADELQDRIEDLAVNVGDDDLDVRAGRKAVELIREAARNYKGEI